jgi:hypothetical protein
MTPPPVDCDPRSQAASARRPARKRLVIAGLMAGGLALGVLAFFTPRYETNDDVGMNAIAAGRMFVDRPDEHVIFTNVLIGWALKGLYRAVPNVPWYGGCLYVCAALSLAAVCFVCLGRGASTLDVCLTGALLLVVGAPFLILMQFTRVAFLATMAGTLLLAGTVRDCRPARQALWGLPFLVAGSLIRFDAFLLAGLVLSPLVVWIVCRARREGGARGAAVVLAGALALGFAFARFNTWYYERDPAWHGFYEFNALRAAFTDYGRGEYNEQTAPVFSSAGWTRIDVELLKDWCFLDRERYNTATLKAVLNALATRERAMEPRPWSELVQVLLNDPELLALWGIGAIFLIALASERSARFVPAGCYLMSAGVCLYLYSALHLPPHVFCPVFGACPVVALMLSAGPRSFGCDKPCLQSTVARAALTVLAVLVLWRGVVLLRENGAFLIAHQAAKDMMRRLAPRADQLFVVWAANFPYEQLDLPFESGADVDGFKVLGLASLGASPFSAARMQEFGVSDLYTILARLGRIFFISTMSENGALAMYFRVHYGRKIGRRLILAHPALGESAVWSLAITGRAPKINGR